MYHRGCKHKNRHTAEHGKILHQKFQTVDKIAEHARPVKIDEEHGDRNSQDNADGAADALKVAALKGAIQAILDKF